MEPRKKRGAPESDSQDSSSSSGPAAQPTNLVPIKGGAPVEVLTADETYANAVHLRIMELLRQYEETYFELADTYPSFERYVEDAVGIDFRKAKYLVSIWWWFGVEQRADPKLLMGAQEIGWSKAKELVGVVDPKNADEWFEIAKTKKRDYLVKAAKAALKKAGRKRRRTAPESVFQGEFDFPEGEKPLPPPPDVVDEQGDEAPGPEDPDETPAPMKTAEAKPPKGMRVADPSPPPGYDSGDGKGTRAQENLVMPMEGVAPPEDVDGAVDAEKAESDKWTRIYFDVHDDFHKTIEVALANAKKTGETEHKGYALSLVCLHYLSFYSKKWSVEIGEWLRRIERVTGLTLVAVDERTDEIIYDGNGLLRKLAAEGEEESDGGEQGVGDAGDGVGEEGAGVVDQGAEEPSGGEV
jgi:hypothetical protein